MGTKKPLDEVKVEKTVGEVVTEEAKLEKKTEDEPSEAVEPSPESDPVEAEDSEASDDATKTEDADVVEPEAKAAVAQSEETVQVAFNPKGDHPGMLNGMQVQPGEVHTVPMGAWNEVKGNKDYKQVK